MSERPYINKYRYIFGRSIAVTGQSQKKITQKNSSNSIAIRSRSSSSSSSSSRSSSSIRSSSSSRSSSSNKTAYC